MLPALIPIIGGLLEKIIPDPKASAEAKTKLLELQQQGELAYLDAEVKLATGQLEINKIEAASTSLFVSGWRPAVGWLCASGCGYTFVLWPILSWASLNFGWTQPPQLDANVLMGLLSGLLGLGGLRTVEKIKSVAAK